MSETPRTVALMARQFDEARKIKDSIPREEIAAAWIDLAMIIEAELTAAQAALSAAEQRAEAMERDAARYRMLRDDSEGFEVTVRELDDEGGELWVAGYPPNELDQAIDSAIRHLKESKEKS